MADEHLSRPATVEALMAKQAYEHGARELKPRTGPDPNDDFSQKAAENRKPRHGIGLTDPPSERSENDKSDFRKSPTGRPQEDN